MSVSCPEAFPDWPSLRSVVPGIVWPAIAEDRAAHLLALCQQIEHTQWWPGPALHEAQREQLRALIAHAVRQVPHYAAAPAYRRFLDAGEAQAWNAFQALPVLNRGIVTDTPAFSAVQLPPHHGEAIDGKTSGSSGAPLSYRMTPLAQALGHALIMRDHRWHRRDFALRHAFIRLDHDMPSVAGWGAPSAILFEAGASSVRSPWTPDNELAAWLADFNPHYLLAHPVNVRALVRMAREGHLRLPALRQIRTLGENVRDSLRRDVRERWGVEIADMYSTTECGLIALQCPETGLYHIQSETVVAEVLDDAGQPCPPGQLGRVVVTPLHNFAFPLIRYETGDYAEAAGPCPCGRGLPTLRKVLGRRSHRLHLPDGRTQWPQLCVLDWMSLAPELTRFRMVQAPDYSLDFRFVASRLMRTEETDRIAGAIRTMLDCDLPLRMEQVDELPLQPAGKFADFSSLVDAAAACDA